MNVFAINEAQLRTMSYRQLMFLRKQSYSRITCGCEQHCGDDALSEEDQAENAQMCNNNFD